MSFNKFIWKPVLALGALLVSHPVFAANPLANPLIDSASIEFGTGKKVQLLRLSAQKNWERIWFQSDGTHLSGYWDANLAQWCGNAFENQSGRHQNITVLGLTPVFRFERTDKKGWYGEAGIGIALISKIYDNAGEQLSTHFQFGDHLGAGYVFDNRWEFGAKVQHYSNGGIKHPNSGVNWLVVKATYHY